MTVTAFSRCALVELQSSQHSCIVPAQPRDHPPCVWRSRYRVRSCPGRGIRDLTRRRGRVVQARACKALYMGSIPIVASSLFAQILRCGPGFGPPARISAHSPSANAVSGMVRMGPDRCPARPIVPSCYRDFLHELSEQRHRVGVFAPPASAERFDGNFRRWGRDSEAAAAVDTFDDPHGVGADAVDQSTAPAAWRPVDRRC